MRQKTAKTILSLIILIMLAVVIGCVAALTVGSDALSCHPLLSDDDPVILTYGKLERLELLEDSYHIAAGSQIALRLRTEPELYEDVITWSSTDTAVLQVDRNGIVTACGGGTADIIVTCRDMSDRVTISVVDDIIARAADCVDTLAESCDADKAASAELLTEQLGRCLVEGAPEWRELLLSIIAYIDGGDRPRLESAMNAAGADRLRVNSAALCCWAYGEQKGCDAVLTFAGDCTLARFNESAGQGRFPSVYAASGSYTYPFDRVRGLFACDAMTVINFEGTLTESSNFRQKNFYFRGSPDYAGILPASSIEAANLANNHTYDYHQTGFDDTLRYLTDAGVLTVSQGAPLEGVLGKDGRVVFVAANSGGEVYTDALHNELLEAVRANKDDDTAVICCLHWGREGSAWYETWQRERAYELIDAGADLIVGHHPHVMQGIEIYNGRYIAYSLGNFAFGGNGAAGNPETCILRAKLGRGDAGGYTVLGISVVPGKITSTGTVSNNYQPMVCFGEEGDGVYRTLVERSPAGVVLTRPAI